MFSQAKLDGLKKFCDTFGGNIEYSQGGGTNASVKDDGNMIIKASGYTLADMISKGGYVELNYKPIAEIYTTKNSITEDEARRITQTAVRNDTKPKPSIETGFHSFLNTFVIHLHPIYLIALLCLEECENILGELYKGLNFAVAEYKRPGHHLSREVAGRIFSRDPSTPPSTRFTRSGFARDDNKSIVIFLKNHGLIVSGDDADICLNTAREICDRAKEYVLQKTGLAPFVYSVLAKDESGCLGCHYEEAVEYLYPDAVVFLRDINGKGGEQTKDIDEILFAHNAILQLAKRLGRYRALSPLDVQELIEMEEEKYRRAMIGTGGTK